MLIVLVLQLVLAAYPIATSNWLRDLINVLPNPF